MKIQIVIVTLMGLLALLFGTAAKADIYSRCFDGELIKGTKNSRRIEVELSPWITSYTQYSYLGVSDCSGEPQDTKAQYRFEYIAEEMVGRFRSLTLKFPGEERYLNFERDGDEMLVIISKTYPFYKEFDGKWMSSIITLKRTKIDHY